MRPATKFVSALMVVVLLVFNPISTCAATPKDPSPAAHPCCPAESAPVSDECNDISLCACIEHQPVQSPAQTGPGSIQSIAVPIRGELVATQPAASDALEVTSITVDQQDHYIRLHQLLI